MNTKAQKQSLNIPLELNLSDSRIPSVDSTLSKAEECNAPFMNGMYQPLWKYEDDGYSVYDKEGHKYYIEDNTLKRDGTSLFNVDNKHFVRTDVTEEFQQYLCYDYTDNNKAYMIFDDDDNSVDVYFNNSKTNTGRLYINGAIVATRIKIFNDTVVGVILYNDGALKIKILYNNNIWQSKDGTVTWYRQLPRQSASAAYNPVTYTPESVYPIIYISYLDNSPVVSLVSNYGEVLDSDRTAFSQFVVYNNVLYNSGTIRPINSSTTGEVTTTTYFTFKTSISRTDETVVKTIYRKTIDGEYHYWWPDDLTNEVNVPLTENPHATGNIVDDYSVCTIQMAQKSVTVNVQEITDNGEAWTAAINGVAEPIPKTYTATNWYTQGVDYPSINSIAINVMNEETVIPSSAWNSEYQFTRTVTNPAGTITYAIAPNIFLEDDKIYALWGFNKTTTTWSTNAIATGLGIVESGRWTGWTLNNGVLYYSFNPTETVMSMSGAQAALSNSFGCGQSFWTSTGRLGYNGTTPTSAGSGTALTSSNVFVEWNNSSNSDLRYWPGTSPLTSYNYNGSNGWEDGYPCFTVNGYRSRINSFNLLYNTFLSGSSTIQGISYSYTDDDMGTLLTEWQSVDPDWYISSDSTSVVYRSSSGKFYKISIEDGAKMTTEFNDRYIIVNTTSFFNCWDSYLNRAFHYATDYNDRTLFGAVTETTKTGAASVTPCATAINANYEQIPRIAISSMLLSQISRYRVTTGNEKAFKCLCPESKYLQGIDVYYKTSYGSYTTAEYQYTILPESTQPHWKNPALYGTVYPLSDSLYLSPNIFTEYISAVGNNDFVKETTFCYPIVYNVDNAIFLYDATTMLENVDDFFCLQGQFYAVINDKLYSLIYSNGKLGEMDAIIDVRGFKFVGNTPSIAFFYSASQRAFYSFTGDANLQHIFNANKIQEANSYYYDESSQSIWIPTDAGLLVFGPQNTYLLSDILNVENIIFSDDGVTHVIRENDTISFKYYYETGYTSNHVKITTSYYGIGNTENGNIDRWNITLFTEQPENSEISLSVRSLTDISTTKENKETRAIQKTDWDSYGNSVLISYVPPIQKGQGIRLSVDSKDCIQNIVPHFSSMGTGTITKITR